MAQVDSIESKTALTFNLELNASVEMLAKTFNEPG